MPVVDLLHNRVEETAGTRGLGQFSLYNVPCLLWLLLVELLLPLLRELLLSWSKLLLLWSKLLLLLEGLLLKLLLCLELLLLLERLRLLLREILKTGLLLLLTKVRLLLLVGVEDLWERSRRLLLRRRDLQALTLSAQTRAIT